MRRAIAVIGMILSATSIARAQDPNPVRHQRHSPPESRLRSRCAPAASG